MAGVIPVIPALAANPSPWDPPAALASIATSAITGPKQAAMFNHVVRTLLDSGDPTDHIAMWLDQE